MDVNLTEEYLSWKKLKNQASITLLSLIIIVLLPGIAIAQTPIFYNEGALFHANPGAFMIIKNASMQNDFGSVDNGGTIEIEGNFINNDQVSGGGTTGVFDIHGNWENNQDFTADQSTVNLIGSNQLLTGTSSTSFFNLRNCSVCSPRNSNIQFLGYISLGKKLRNSNVFKIYRIGFTL